jgi:prepilin-type N-terminal cleavage/methylation domain-containing protein
VTRAQRTYPCSGYTMIEAIMVLVIVGILSVAMLTRTDSITARNVSDQTDLLRRNLTHIQSLALTYGIALRLTVSTAGYTVSCLTTVTPCVTAGVTLIDPTTAQAFTVTLPSGLAMTSQDASNVTATTVDFDSIGRPSTGSALIATNPARTFAITGAARTSSVILRPVTGFAEVSY